MESYYCSFSFQNVKSELQEATKRDKANRADLREKTKQNLRLQHQIDELRNQNQKFLTELGRHQAMVAGMSGEEIV